MIFDEFGLKPQAGTNYFKKSDDAYSYRLSEIPFSTLAGTILVDISERPKINVTRHRVELDPPIEVFNVELTKKGGCWMETWGSKDQLQAFLKGIEAGLGIVGFIIFWPEIPHKIVSVLTEKKNEEVPL